MGPCPDAVKKLIDRFNQQSDQIRSPDYNETQLRIDFINPLFRQLGWDMDNTQGFAEQYREVVHEDRIKVAGATKAPDYSFRIGGVRKFFLEAKKPFVNIKQAWEPAYQLRRYAWSAKLAVSILTDFEELAIYDCRVTPRQMEKPATARREFITYTDYCQRWDFLEGTFSKRAILTGEFDRYCASKKGRGALEFDQAFLVEIEDWRKKLASNLALRNDLSEHDLNFATQRIIDRIIFLRICEDRGVEPIGHLQQLLNGDNIYQRLTALFRDADARYNSGLFHFKKETGRDEAPDELTLTLEIDDATLKSVLRRLYYPESPYEFAVVSADILGSVYERFLGKVIALSGGHRVKIEEKPEVRKAGGVYYTPTYIVDYIIKQTIGKLLSPSPSTLGEGRGEGGAREGEAPAEPSPSAQSSAPREPRPPMTPKESAKLKILDPACGSGSFLLGAYQYLLDWHLKWYVNDGPEKHSKGKNATIRPADRPSLAQPLAGALISPSPSTLGEGKGEGKALGHWALTTAERKRILLDNIHGVDIDYQAVEVTKLSLLLRCLEGETAESIRAFSTLFRERALPDLGRNIQCGNSLIGTDIMTTDAWREMSEEERRRINPFDFERAFPKVFRPSPSPGTPGEGRGEGGFDAVIGNPPYVLLQDEFRDDRQLAYFRANFKAASFKLDTYHLFIERAIAKTRLAAWIGLITPANFLTNNHLAPLRRLIVESLSFTANTISGGVFQGISVDTTISIGQKRAPKRDEQVRLISSTTDGEKLLVHSEKTISVADVLASDHHLFTGASSKGAKRLFERLEAASVQLGRIASVNFGKQLRDRKVFFNDVIKIDNDGRIPRGYNRCFTGKDITRYSVRWGGLACLASDEARRGGCWDEEKHRGRNKLLTRQIGRWPEFALDADGFDCLNTIFMVSLSTNEVDPRYVLGILNSRAVRAYWHERFYDQRETFPKIKGTYLKLLPIRAISNSAEDRRVHDQLVREVESILSLHAAEVAAKSPQEKEQLRRRIGATDRQIDQLVYQLYGLTDDEIKLVEESTR